MPMAIGEPSVTPPRTPPSKRASSFSIFMRPPRPYPCWRRASSEATKSGSTASPEGIPSRIAVRRGPCDSPAVRRRSTRRVYFGTRSAVLKPALQRVDPALFPLPFQGPELLRLLLLLGGENGPDFGTDASAQHGAVRADFSEGQGLLADEGFVERLRPHGFAESFPAALRRLELGLDLGGMRFQDAPDLIFLVVGETEPPCGAAEAGCVGVRLRAAAARGVRGEVRGEEAGQRKGPRAGDEGQRAVSLSRKPGHRILLLHALDASRSGLDYARSKLRGWSESTSSKRPCGSSRTGS